MAAASRPPVSVPLLGPRNLHSCALHFSTAGTTHTAMHFSTGVHMSTVTETATRFLQA
jgi:hypothetical protein